MSSDTDLCDAIPIKIIHDVQRVKDGVLRWVGLPHQSRLVVTLIIREELEAAYLLISPGVAPSDPLQAFDIRQNFCPTFMERLMGWTQLVTAIKIECQRPWEREFRRLNRHRFATIELKPMIAFARDYF